MKKLLLFFFLLPIFSLHAQKPAVIVGSVTHAVSDTFRLHWLENHFAERERFVDVVLDKKKHFRTQLNLRTPAYVGFSYGNDALLFYVQPGDSLVFSFDGKDVVKTATFKGPHAADNLMLQEYTTQFKTIRKDNEQHIRNDSAMAYKAFRDTMEQQQLRFVESRKSKISRGFYVQLRSDIRYSACLDRINYVKRSRFYSIRPGEEETVLPGYYDFFYRRGIIDDSALVSPAYTRFVDLYLFHQYLRTVNFSRTLTAIKAPEMFTFAKLVLTGKTLDQEVVSLTHFALTTEEIPAAGEMIDLLKAHQYDTTVVNVLERKLNALKAFGPGAPAPLFTLTSVDGKQVSLSDFKGKIVYLDFWASWCGPCMREMPNSAELHKKFVDKDVVFLYVSLDTDEAKWRKTIEDKHIEGVNLVVGKSTVARDYSVNLIPRYVVIDRNGNLVDGNASRPSDKGTEALLNRLLSER